MGIGQKFKPWSTTDLSRFLLFSMHFPWYFHQWLGCPSFTQFHPYPNGYGSIPINTIFRGMNIHLPAILMFTRGTRFWHTAKWISMSSIEFHPVPLFSRYFLADRVVEMTVEMFREPRKMVQEISGLGLRHVPQHPKGAGEHLGMNQKMKPPWEPEILGFMFSMNHLIMGVPVFWPQECKSNVCLQSKYR